MKVKREMGYNSGDRVRISPRYNWAKGVKGTVQIPPDSVQGLVEDQAPYQGCHRFVKGRRGFIEFYWVEFDEPQIDADGDGPYSGGEIEADMLEPADERGS